MMHVSPQPGHLTGHEGSAHPHAAFAPHPVMYMPQMHDQAFLFHNQQLVQNALAQNAMAQNFIMPQVTQQVTEVEEERNREGSAASTPSSLAVTTSPITSPLNLPTVAPAQYMNPLVFPQVPMNQQQFPQFVPCVVPGGAFPPTFQPMYFVQQQNAPVFNQPGQHPVMRSDSSHSRHEPSKSYDGTEFVDRKSNSLRRFSSDHSNDGYGSDFWDNRSRIGSEQHEDAKDEERKVQSQRYYQNNQYVDHHNSNKKNQYRGRERSRSGSQKRPTSKERQEEMYKTELCSAWVNQKKCRFGHRCIFAHGTHELRAAKRKQDRQKMRPPLKKFMTGLLNKLCEGNYEQVITEFMTVCLEEVSERNMSSEGADIMKAFFNKVVAERELREQLVESMSKMFRSHPYANSLKEYLSNACLSEYKKPRSKAVALSTIDLVSMLVSRRIIDEQIVHEILGETRLEDPKQIKVELWLRLIENLKDNVDTARYFSDLAKFKAMSTRIRFAIMDLEDLQKNNWNPRM